MMTMSILVFMKHWNDSSKTRLVPAIGKQGASTVSKWLTQRCVRTVRHFTKTLQHNNDGIEKINLRFWCGGQCETGTKKLEEHFGKLNKEAFIRQDAGDLGARLIYAVEDAFKEGSDRIVIVGTDIPGIDNAILAQAFQALDKVDVVLGPAHDGGYYLIGMKRPIPQLFRNISWSTSEVLQQTLQAARGAGLVVKLLRPLQDIDLPSDLDYWEQLSGISLHRLPN